MLNVAVQARAWSIVTLQVVAAVEHGQVPPLQPPKLPVPGAAVRTIGEDVTFTVCVVAVLTLIPAGLLVTDPVAPVLSTTVTESAACAETLRTFEVIWHEPLPAVAKIWPFATAVVGVTEIGKLVIVGGIVTDGQLNAGLQVSVIEVG